MPWLTEDWLRNALDNEDDELVSSWLATGYVDIWLAMEENGGAERAWFVVRMDFVYLPMSLCLRL